MGSQSDARARNGERGFAVHMIDILYGLSESRDTILELGLRLCASLALSWFGLDFTWPNVVSSTQPGVQ